MKSKASAGLSLKEFEQKVKSLFISRNTIAESFEGMLLGFESKVPQDQLSLLDIIIEKCSSSPERLEELKEAGGYEKFISFFLQSKNDETEENPDFYILGFQLLKILVLLDKSGFNSDAFKVFIEVFWKSSNLEIILGALLYIKQLADSGPDLVYNLIRNTQAEMKVAIKWLRIVGLKSMDPIPGGEANGLIRDVPLLVTRWKLCR
jgi:hypothetical protein